MAAALQTVSELRGDAHAVAVLADMLELGASAPDAHRAAGERARALGIPVVALGSFQAELGGEAASDPDDAARRALALTSPGDWILVKASRGMALERVVEALARVGAG